MLDLGQHLFRDFQRAGVATHRKYGGTDPGEAKADSPQQVFQRGLNG